MKNSNIVKTLLFSFILIIAAGIGAAAIHPEILPDALKTEEQLKKEAIQDLKERCSEVRSNMRKLTNRQMNAYLRDRENLQRLTDINELCSEVGRPLF